MTRPRLTTLTAIILVVVGALVAVANVTTGALADWGPNIATELWGIAIVIAVVDRTVERHQRDQARGRVEQALLRIRAGSTSWPTSRCCEGVTGGARRAS